VTSVSPQGHSDRSAHGSRILSLGVLQHREHVASDITEILPNVAQIAGRFDPIPVPMVTHAVLSTLSARELRNSDEEDLPEEDLDGFATEWAPRPR
jgi:hypothetical protein